MLSFLSENTYDAMYSMFQYWQHLKRQLLNMAANMIPWELRIKQIESHFGSVVGESYGWDEISYYVSYPCISTITFKVFLGGFIFYIPPLDILD